MKIIAQNKKASYEYTIYQTYQCGIVLKGTEIKSIRMGHVSIQDSYVAISKKQEAWIYNMNISKYEKGNIFNHEEKRDRKLLLHKAEIYKIQGRVTLEGYTLVPLKVYLDQGLCKVEIAIAKGKKLYDKRESLKEKDNNRRIEKQMKNAY